MSNLIEWIKDEAHDEPIKAVVIGKMGWGNESVPNSEKQPLGVILTWKEAKKWLNYEFSSDYGAPECNAIYAWTKTRVIFVSQYDGATRINSIPRNPTPTMPYMPGG